ncbi:hypothetical protein OPT61_g8034 [Boeremia exigua]|uniref:Uncharacterized protein n=1 Tax=Boeremia exigua TaxID=749465 RepID=A0ACC2HZU4_9PLEO|nr:hypothetical protein OPT61_g8034 [Boeremia exigua]
MQRYNAQKYVARRKYTPKNDITSAKLAALNTHLIPTLKTSPLHFAVYKNPSLYPSQDSTRSLQQYHKMPGVAIIAIVYGTLQLGVGLFGLWQQRCLRQDRMFTLLRRLGGIDVDQRHAAVMTTPWSRNKKITWPELQPACSDLWERRISEWRCLRNGDVELT